MQFPAQLTQGACRARPRELRLVCIYFFTDYFFQVSVVVRAPSWASVPSPLASARGPAPGGASPLCSLSRPLSLLGLGFRRTGSGRRNFKKSTLYVSVPGWETDEGAFSLWL